jgi:uncharacterized repeat protein (TIGR01451 family)
MRTMRLLAGVALAGLVWGTARGAPPTPAGSPALDLPEPPNYRAGPGRIDPVPAQGLLPPAAAPVAAPLTQPGQAVPYGMPTTPLTPPSQSTLVMPLTPPARQAPPPARPAAPAEAMPVPAPAVAPSVKDIPLGPADGPSNDNPTGRQEPAVSLEWIGPPVARVGEPVVYQLLVKNICGTKVHHVSVQAVVPKGTTVSATEPKSTTKDDLLVWELGTLEPRQESRLDIQLVPGSTGAVNCQAFITITGGSAAHFEVREPKLTVKATAPAKAVVGDPATVTLTIHNPGDATAERVKVQATLSDGLQSLQGQKVEFQLDSLPAKESRTVLIPCGAKVAGEQTCTALVSAEPKLSAEDKVSIEVQCPKLEVAVAGPGMRYLDRHAALTFKVTNPGTAAAEGVMLVDQIPQGFKIINATEGGRHDFVARTVTWSLGKIEAGGSKEVNLELVAVNPGEHRNLVSVTAARGLHAEGELLTRVEGLPALLMDLIDVDDPVEVGADTSYEIRVTNTGTKTETNLQLTCTLPDKMEFRAAKCGAPINHHVEGREVIFDPLPKLAPRADVIYRVSVRGVDAGDLRFQARMKADGLTVPVLKEESTRVYGDEGGSKPKAPEAAKEPPKELKDLPK